MIISKIAALVLCAQSTNGFIVKPQFTNIQTKITPYTSTPIPHPQSKLSMSQTEETSDLLKGKVVEEEEKPKKKKKSPPPTPPVVIDISKLDIRVGIIKNAYNHEAADKLYCEEIDIGEESPRNIASGIRAYYETPEDIIGKKVLVLSNLKSRKLVGFPSHGMILCSSTPDEGVVIVEPPEDAEVGDRIMVNGYEGEPASENQVIKKKMLDKILPDLKTDGQGIVTYNDVPLETSSGGVIQGFLKNAPVS